MSVPVRLAKRALREAVEVFDWWKENRPLATTLFADEYRAAVQLLIEVPEAGVVSPSHPGKNIRRLLLRSTKYHLYYRYDAAKPELVILCVWNAIGGKPPKI